MSNIRRSAYLLGAIAALSFGVSVVWRPTPPPKFTGLDRNRIPQTVAGYSAQGDEQFSSSVRAALAAADLLSRNYQGPGGQMINFTLIAGTDRSALHDPRSCLVGAGWRIENDHTEIIPGTDVSARTCQVVNSETKQRNEMVYLYVVDKKTINQVTDIRFQMLLSALVGQKGKPTTFVRFMRSLTTDGTDDTSKREQFLQFAAQMWKAMKLTESADSTRQVAEAN